MLHSLLHVWGWHCEVAKRFTVASVCWFSSEAMMSFIKACLSTLQLGSELVPL